MTRNQDRQRDDASRGLTPGEREFFPAESDEWSVDEERLDAAGAAAPAAPRERPVTPAADRDSLAAPERFDEPRADRSGGVPARRDRLAEPAADATESAGRLFRDEEAAGLRERWNTIQTAFVDEPRVAVEQADGLVEDVVQRLTDGFSGERARLERQWDRGDSVSTEDLRVALKRYRAFFDRLLSI